MDEKTWLTLLIIAQLLLVLSVAVVAHLRLEHPAHCRLILVSS